MKPLDGIRVLDLTRFVAGSYATMSLASLGAEVWKLELPPQGDPYRRQGTAFIADESALFLALNNGKQSVAFDFRADEASEVVTRMIEACDVLVQNAKPGSLGKYRLDWDHVHETNPRLVYASISGYGEVGPDAPRGGFDMVLQAESGLMSMTSEPGEPPMPIGAPLLDIGAGISCLTAIFAGLWHREQTGLGTQVSSSLFEFAIAGLTTVMATYLASGQPPRPTGRHSPLFAPYGLYPTSDDYLVIAGTGTEDLWHRFCEVLERADLANDDRFTTNADRVANRDALDLELTNALTRESADIWVDRLGEAGVPAGRVANIEDVAASDQIRALGFLPSLRHKAVGEYTGVSHPFRLDGMVVAPNHGAPVFGADTLRVLHQLGCTKDEITHFLERGIAVHVP